MKLTLGLLLLLIVQGWAINSYSQKVVVNLDLKNVDIIKVLDEIEKQTDYYFLFNYEQIHSEKKIDVKLSNSRIDEVLNKILEGTGLNYSIKNRQIVISKDTSGGLNEQFSSSFSQQQKTISGKVTDSSGAPLPGVSVVVKGTTTGVITDIDGKYNLPKVPDNAALQFSFVGMKSQEIPVAGKSTIDVVLKEESIGIDEVVAVGYGTARRKDISGAVSTIKLEDSPAALLPTTNALQSLQGSIAGVNVLPQSSPGVTPSIIVRGQNSINGGNDPLIVLDGNIFMGIVSDINPEDIATIDVLKDASATAVYGSRAANGVIIITSKSGKSGKPIIRYNTSIGINTWANPPKLMNTERWAEKYAAQMHLNSPSDIVFDDVVRNSLFAQGVNTDWIDLISRNGFIQDHQVSVSGKSDRINYYFSGGYNSSKGVIVGDNYKRIAVRSKLDADITDWLEVGVDGIYNKNDFTGASASVSNALRMPSFAYPYRWASMPNDVASATGKQLERYPMGTSIENPLWGTDGTVQEIDKKNFFRLATYGLFKVPKVDGLTYRFDFSINSYFKIRDQFNYEDYYVGEQTKQPYIDRYSPAALAGLLQKANGYNKRTNIYSWVMNNIVNYKKQFGTHYIDLTLVATRDYSYEKEINASGSDYRFNGNTLLGVDGIHKASVQSINLNVVEEANIGYLGRISYAYKDKYHLTASMRRDGASVFGRDKKWGNFPSVGVAWTVSKEDFMSEFNKLNYLKIKASYGQNGNQSLDPYQTLAKAVSGKDGGIRYEFGDAPSTIMYGAGQTLLGNPSLGWETTTAFNGGFQSAWLNNRVSLDLDFYFSKTTDQIFSRQIPVMNGFTSILASLGQVNNKGIEISLRTVNIEKANIKWSSGLNFWQNRNKIVSLYGDDNNGDGKEDDDIGNNLFIGKSLGAIYGYEYIGVVQSDDAEYIKNVGAVPGDPKFKDISGPNGVPDGKITADYDRKILGYGKENFSLSFSNTVEYKNFELYVMLTGIFGGGKDNYYLKSNPRYNSFDSQFFINDYDHDWWTPENKSTKYLRPDFNGNRYLGLQSRGFVKVQDVNLSYTLPKGILSCIGVQSLKVFASVKNLYTFTNWFGGGDPERGIQAGLAQGDAPVPRTYSMGLNVSF